MNIMSFLPSKLLARLGGTRLSITVVLRKLKQDFQIQVQLELPREFQASLGYISKTLYQKKRKCYLLTIIMRLSYMY